MSAWMFTKRWMRIAPLLLLACLMFTQGCGRRGRAARQAQSHAMDIKGLAYDWERRGMEIEFAGGVVYRYSNIHPKTFEHFKDASSPRDFYHNTIQGRASFVGFDHVEPLNVSSEAFESIAYHPASELLLVRFNANSVFEYLDVPFDAVEALVNADSVAQHFSRSIRGKFPSNRL